MSCIESSIHRMMKVAQIAFRAWGVRQPGADEGQFGVLQSADFWELKHCAEFRRLNGPMGVSLSSDRCVRERA